jgi:hypothetical protein
MTPRLTPRFSIGLTFAIFGVGTGLWMGASAALISRSGVGDAVFGSALTAFTIVYMFAMSMVSTLARWAGVKRVIVGAALGVCPTLALLLLAASSVQLIAGLILYGFAGGVLDSAMNAEAAALERALRVPIIARFHGLASVGAALGAILGSAVVGGPAPWIGAALGVALYFLAAVAVGVTPAVEARKFAVGVGEFPARVLTRSLVVIGLVAGIDIACETAAMTWSPPLLSSEAPSLAPIVGLGGAFFAGCQAILRLNADRLRAHIDDRSLIAISLAVAATGFLIVALPLGFAGSVVGFALFGFGAGAIVPCSFALAGTRPGVSAAASISAVAFFGLFPRVPTPFLIGVVASEFSLSAAFLALAALLMTALAAMLVFVPAPKIVLRRAAP